MGSERTPAIRSLHWDELPPEIFAGAWTSGHGRVLAVWPGPVDHDACFAAAGFSEFADSNERWDAEFIELIRSLVDFLRPIGGPRLHGGEYPKPGLLTALGRLVGHGRDKPSPLDALVAAARDDRFPPCIVHFGDPVRAVVRTCHGHPLLWVWTAPTGPDREKLIGFVAGDRQVLNTTLDWKLLA